MAAARSSISLITTQGNKPRARDAPSFSLRPCCFNVPLIDTSAIVSFACEAIFMAVKVRTKKRSRATWRQKGAECKPYPTARARVISLQENGLVPFIPHLLTYQVL